ncbi:MAG: hypothetical protein WDM80_15920 [Limisphaerales bacterium]
MSPKKILTNADLEKMVETSDEWITTRTGIKERRIAAEDEFTSDMAANAAEQAMKMAGVTPDQINLIIVATVTRTCRFPARPALCSTKLVQKKRRLSTWKRLFRFYLRHRSGKTVHRVAHLRHGAGHRR